MQPRNLRPVPDDEILTQFGTNERGFTEQPRWWMEVEVSLIGDEHPLSAEEACAKIRWAKVCSHNAPNGDLARWTTAGTLREKGFLVEQCGRNLWHVGVTHPSHSETWDAATKLAFEDAFKEGVADG